MNWNDIIDLAVLKTKLLTYAPKVIAALIILLAFHYVFKITHEPLKRIFRKAGFDYALTAILVDNIFRISLLIVAVIMAAGQLGINVGAAVAGIGIVGIAIGFAAQDVLSSVIAGFMIFYDKPFLIGDWITVEDHYGEVTEITIRSTRIRTPNNTYVVIPNKIIVDSVLNNHSKNGETRLEIPIGIAYKEDILQAREVLLEAISTIENVMKNPKPAVVVEELGDSSINLLVHVWIQNAKVEKSVFFETVETCKLALDKAGIEIPFPHLQLFVDDVKKRVWDGKSAAEKA